MDTFKNNRSLVAGLVVLVVLVLCSLACGCIVFLSLAYSYILLPELGGGWAVQPAQTAPGEKIILSEDPQIKGFPQSVISYGDGQTVTLTNLQLKKDKGGISGSVRYKRDPGEEFVLVVYCTTPKQLLVVYYDQERRLTLLPRAGSRWNVLFSMSGYELKGGESEGTVEFYFPTQVSNTYDVRGMAGKVFVFSVKGQVNPRRALPGEQQDSTTFQANSNVLEVKMGL